MEELLFYKGTDLETFLSILKERGLWKSNDKRVIKINEKSITDKDILQTKVHDKISSRELTRTLQPSFFDEADELYVEKKTNNSIKISMKPS